MRENNFKFLIFNFKLNSILKIQHSTSARRAFSMVELIFVIVLIGILAGIGVNFMPDNRLLNDTNYITMKIKETQRNAIGNDINGFSAPWSKENNSTCITFTKDFLESLDKYSQKPHKLSSSISPNPTICFDELGRPYQEEHLLLKKLDINITLGSRYHTISVMPMSGYVIIRK